MVSKWHEENKTEEYSFSEILQPCKICSKERITIANGYCYDCYMDEIRRMMDEYDR